MTRSAWVYLILLLLLGSNSLGAQEPIPIPTPIGGTFTPVTFGGGYKPIFQTRDRFLTIFCNGELEPERAAKVADEVRAAYAFVRQTQGWRGQEVLDQPLWLGVNAKMRAGVWGWARRNVFVIGLTFLDDGHFHETIAHELTHCQDNRQLGPNHLIPHYFLEGRAILMGHAYSEKMGHRPDIFDRRQRQRLQSYTWREAQEVLKEWAGEKEPAPGPALVRLEIVGGFFLDYLRLHYTGEAGDIQPRTAKIVEDVGSGMTYEAAFRKELGVTLEVAIKAFEEHLWDTQSHPDQRFQGTIWEDL